MTIPEIVKAYVIKTCGRMPETQAEIDEYLDLINHAKEYEKSLLIKSRVGEKFMKKLGLKTPSEIIADGKKQFLTPTTDKK